MSFIRPPRSIPQVRFPLHRNYYRPRHLQTPLPTNTIVKFVPQQQAWVVERFGKFCRILEPGLTFLFPFIDQIRYVQSLKEQAVEVPTQSAITQGEIRVSFILNFYR